MTLCKIKKALASILVTIFLFSLVVPVVPAEAAQNTNLEQKVVEVINKARLEKGISELQVDPALTAVAREQAQKLADSYRGSYDPLYNLMKSGSYEAVKASVLRTGSVEYVVKYQVSKSSSFAGLSEKYNLVGIGIVDSSIFNKVCVEVFAKGQPVGKQPQNTQQTSNQDKNNEDQNNQPQVPQQPANKNENKTPVQQPQDSQPKNAVPSINEFQKKIVELVNKERAKEGLQPLVAKADLNKVAQLKAEDMAKNNYFSHTSPTYGSPFDMMKQFGINYSYAGENIAVGYRTPESVMEGWMNSPGHRKNILNPNFTEIGVGFTADGYYWVQHFVKR
ncbi:putative YkwD family protein [Desulfohalotomaculum tongense]|uniref:CAP domain-containing protein n=1 Tax=Desulforadius tongensis TaxID=1216062 RepID=UPI00195B65D5|nr:CAP domain-containing protein [Desulforadius tongensis]MBM7855188.1 putative YkwD family protein [Desulforadius tongensis]